MGHRVSFRRPEQDGFRLETADVAEGRSLWQRLFGRARGPKAQWVRYASAGSAHEAGNDEVEADVRSWRRFGVAVTVVVIIWLLGALG